MRLRWTAAALGAAALVGWIVSPTEPARSDTVVEVRVINQPEIQRVAGAVAIDGPLPASRTLVFHEVTVQPVEPYDTARLVEAGSLETKGFTHVVLSLHGVTKGRPRPEGELGVLLLPDVEPVRKSFIEDGLTPFAITARAGDLGGGRSTFASAPARALLAFPRYRVYLFNTTDKTATVELWAHLTL